MEVINQIDPIQTITGAVAIAEILVRIIPTKKNWSVVTKIIKIVKAILPNLKKTDKGEITKHDE